MGRPVEPRKGVRGEKQAEDEDVGVVVDVVSVSGEIRDELFEDPSGGGKHGLQAWDDNDAEEDADEMPPAPKDAHPACEAQGQRVDEGIEERNPGVHLQ